MEQEFSKETIRKIRTRAYNKKRQDHKNTLSNMVNISPLRIQKLLSEYRTLEILESSVIDFSVASIYINNSKEFEKRIQKEFQKTIDNIIRFSKNEREKEFFLEKYYKSVLSINNNKN